MGTRGAQMLLVITTEWAKKIFQLFSRVDARAYVNLHIVIVSAKDSPHVVVLLNGLL